jgi:integrase/recombinase XerD
LEENLKNPNIKTFFMSDEEYATVSVSNRQIAERYFDKSLENNTKTLSHNTVRYNARIIGFALKHIKGDLTNLSVHDIDDFTSAVTSGKREDGQPVAASTKKQYYIGFKRFMIWYGKRYGKKSEYKDLADLIEVKGKSKEKNVDEMLTDIEIKQMIATAGCKRDKAIIAVLAEAGCRIGEIVSCFVKDVIKINKDLYKLIFPRGKTGTRTAVLCKSAPYLLDYLKNEHPGPMDGDAPLWVVKMYGCYKAMGYSTISNMIRDVAKAAKIQKRVYPHLFRHTCATRLIGKGLSEPRVKQYLGWKPNSNMTATYIHLDDRDLIASVSELNGLIEKRVDSKGLEVGKCPHCFSSIPTTSAYCFNCSEPLTKEAKSNNDLLIEALKNFFLNNTDLQALLMSKLLGANQ